MIIDTVKILFYRSLVQPLVNLYLRFFNSTFAAMSESSNLRLLKPPYSAKERGTQAFTLSVCILLFSISFPYAYSAAAVGLVVVAWFWAGELPVKFHLLLRRKLLMGWIVFYGLHAVSYIYSTDKDEAAFDLVSKLSFLLLPLLLGTDDKLDDRKLTIYLKSFGAGILFTSLMNLGLVLLKVFEGIRDFGSFTYNSLVQFNETNAVCMAWYTLTCIFAMLIFSYRSLKIPKGLFIFLLAFFQLFFLALSARLLIAIELLGIIPVAYLSYQRHRSRINLLFVGIYFLVMLGVAATDNPISRRYRVVAPSATSDWVLDLNDKKENQHFTNVTLRFFLWKTALESIHRHQYYWYGCGNGDVRKNQFESIERYRNNLHENNLQAEIWRFNVHNMYIQVLYMLGIPGLLVFLVILFQPMFWKSVGDDMYTLFGKVYTLVAAAYMMIESALQTQAGIIFFCSFSCILAAHAYARQKADL